MEKASDRFKIQIIKGKDYNHKTEFKNFDMELCKSSYSRFSRKPSMHMTDFNDIFQGFKFPVQNYFGTQAQAAIKEHSAELM